jgi:hypothetical protein
VTVVIKKLFMKYAGEMGADAMIGSDIQKLIGRGDRDTHRNIETR